MPSEPESIRKSYPDFTLLCSIEREVQFVIYSRIFFFEIDGRRNRVPFHGTNTGQNFYSSCSPRACPAIDLVELMFIL